MEDAREVVGEVLVNERRQIPQEEVLRVGQLFAHAANGNPPLLVIAAAIDFSTNVAVQYVQSADLREVIASWFMGAANRIRSGS